MMGGPSRFQVPSGICTRLADCGWLMTIGQYHNGSLGGAQFIAGQNIDVFGNVSELVIQFR